MKQTGNEQAIDAVRERFRRVILAGDPPAEACRWRLRRFERGLKLADEIEAQIGSLAGRRVLDVGAAFGGDSAAMYARGARSIGADKFDHNYGGLKDLVAPHDGRLGFVRFDCTTPWPLATDSIDVVISLGLLEFVQDLDSFFSETARVLKPNGIAAVYTPPAMRAVWRDAHYKLPLISLLPPPARSWVAENIFRRSYRFRFSEHTYYSAHHIKRYVVRHGFDVLPMKYSRSRVMARVALWPLGNVWQALVRYLAFDFVFVIPRGRRRV